MTDDLSIEYEANRSLERLLGRLEARFRSYANAAPEQWATFTHRLEEAFQRLFQRLYRLYSGRYDFFYYLEELLGLMAQAWIDRPRALKALDAEREANPTWFQTNEMIGGMCYVDRFAGDLEGLRERLPYLKALGLNYLHLMPLFQAPEGENDGGYAVSSYREVDPSLGTMDELRALASELRQQGMWLVLDFIFNHTSDEHEWARRAKAGEREFEAHYYLFPDRTMPDRYDAHLREIFPDEHRGSFTYYPDLDKWVWTTFHSYQWDLNYTHPSTFNRMASEMLFLANLGVDVLRLDALAFIWKKVGTDCENLPEAHVLIQAFNAVAAIVAPGLLLKSEAIVHPEEVARYIGPGECHLSYNPLLMALLWESLATREVRLLRHSMEKRSEISPQCAWVNYVRCHDDIGWTFSDEDAAEIGINGFDHRQFLNAFYTGAFAGSFARGLPFQFNPRTGDMRISGTCGSLAGLEKALREGDPTAVDLAIRRILLMHAIILSIGGIPLIYLGDEVGQLNDYGYRDDPGKADDSRWVHRPQTNWEKIARRHDQETVEGRLYSRMRHLIELRKATPAFWGIETSFIETQNTHVFGYVRHHAGDRVLVLANFSEESQPLDANVLRVHGLGYQFADLTTEKEITAGEEKGITLGPYQVLWLETL